MNKSIQYVTADVDQDAPNRFHDLRVPQVTMSIVNGQVDNISIVDGGSGWQTLDAVPDVYITAPLTTTGKRATVNAQFVGGAMTGIQVTDGGSGYSSSSPPQLQIRNVHKVVDRTIDNGAYRSTYADDIIISSAYVDLYAPLSMVRSTTLCTFLICNCGGDEEEYPDPPSVT